MRTLPGPSRRYLHVNRAEAEIIDKLVIAARGLYRRRHRNNSA